LSSRAFTYISRSLNSSELPISFGNKSSSRVFTSKYGSADMSSIFVLDADFSRFPKPKPLPTASTAKRCRFNVTGEENDARADEKSTGSMTR